MKKNNFIKKLLIFFIIVAVVFGIYTLFFSEKAENLKYYVDSSTELVSYQNFRKNFKSSNQDNINQLIIDLNRNLSTKEIKNKDYFPKLFGEFVSNIISEKEKGKEIYVYEDLIVNFEDKVTQEQIKAIEKKYDIKLKLNSIFSDEEKLYKFNVSGKTSEEVVKMLNSLTDSSKIEYAQPSYIYSAYQINTETGKSGVDSDTGSNITKEREFKVNDPRYDEQWNFKDIKMPIAWNQAKNRGKDVVVAVIDTGVSTVEDLASSQFVEGYNFVNDDKNAKDDHGHGTHVAGTIAQTTNNRKGVTGIAFNSKIMPLKVLNKNGFGNITDIAEAIKYAADNGANVINMSLGGGGRNQVMEDAVKYAQKKGVVIVAAAGNENRNKASYPAYYDGVVSVASYGPKGERAFYSNYGDGVRISAPGGDKKVDESKGGILQNTITGYEWYQGTSMASPHVAGVAALIFGEGVKDSKKVIDILYKSARKVDNDSKNYYGAGKLDALDSVKMAQGKSISPDAGVDMSKIFVYIIVCLIAVVLFFIWYNKARSLNSANHIAFMPFFVGMILSTVGLIFPLLFGNNLLTRLLSSSLPNMDLILFNSFTPLFHSALIPFIVVLLLSGHKTLRSFAVAVCIGYAIVLFVDAIFLFNNVAIIPDVTPFNVIDRIFLIINALMSLGLGVAVTKRN